MSRPFLALVALLAVSVPAFAQSVWTDVPASRAEPRDDVRAYRLVALDADALRARLAAPAGRAAPLRMPLPDGGDAEVAVAESPVMAPALQARYPQIRTYAATGDLSGRFSLAPAGLHALFYAPTGPVVIEPVEGDLYAVFHAADLVVPDGLLEGLADDALLMPGAVAPPPEGRRPAATGELLRTYRIAVSARGEYTQARSDGTVAGGLAAVVASLNRANALFERDLSVRFELVADNDELIFTDPSTDPFSGSGSALLDQNQTAVDAAIGVENYDVGHVLGFDEGGGVAYLRAACTDAFKAGGVSGVGNETSLFDLLVFPHELGHQLGAPHAFVEYSPGTGLNPDGVEPGPGYTIMAYGQFAGYRPVDERIGFHFHGASLDDMDRHVRRGGGVCGSNTVTGNDVPVVTVPAPTVTIPVDTPFVLEGEGADASELSFVWEQVDRYGTGNGAVPLFRSIDPGAAASRSFPSLDRALGGEPYPDETLPSRPGTYRFRLSARDGAGGLGTAEVVVTTVSSGDGFRLTSQEAPVVYGPGDPLAVTWDVAGTDGAPLLATAVDVLVSADGGETWAVAAAATANDGEATVTAPDAVSGRGGFVMVRPTDNVFYALSAAPFAIGTAPVAELSAAELSGRVRPSETGETTLTVANRGPAGSTLDFDVTIDYLTTPDGERFEPSVGYQAVRSGEPGGPLTGFENLATTGTALTFSADDDGAAAVSLPFGFPFFGEAYASASVLTNGLLQFVGSTPGAYVNQPIPSADAPDGFIAPFWDDLRLEDGAVYTRTLDDGRFAVQWTDVGRYVASGPDSGAEYTFQVILSPDGTIEVQYGSLDGPTGSATVGIETPDGTGGLQLGYNDGSPSSVSAVRFDPARAWAEVVGGAGSLAGGETAEVTVRLDAATFEEGDRLTGVLLVRTNAGNRPRVELPVRMDVTSAPTAAADGPEGAAVSLLAPNPASSRAALTVALAAPGAVRATLHDVLGREVAVLHDGPAAGALALSVDAGGLAAGAYVVRVAGDGFAETRRLVVVR